MKTACFYAVSILLVLSFAEGAARLTYRLLYDRPYSRTGIGELDPELAFVPREMRDPSLRRQVLHPYLGFVLGTGKPAVEQAHGFTWSFAPEAAPEPGTVSLLVTGGSVAMQAAPTVAKFLSARLEEREGIPVPVRIFAATLGGFKQPQQLMTLNYLLALGARFDLVINIDGLNDAVLPYVDNVRAGVHPVYPRRWDYRIERIGGVDELVRLGELARLRRRKNELLEWTAEHPAAHSAMVGLVATEAFVRADRRVAELTLESAAAPGELSFEAAGPPFDASDPGESYRFSIELWRRASLQMHQLASANGISYLHVLQPNQYFGRTKPLSAEERRLFHDPESKFGQAASASYPLLLAAGQELRGRGVDFFDASRIFSDVEDTIYIDDCCHLNLQGTLLLAAEVAERGAAALPAPLP